MYGHVFVSDIAIFVLKREVNGHLFILIRQMAALVRRALAEVCTVPVLLVLSCIREGYYVMS